MVAARAGSARRLRVASLPAAVTIPPIHARNVPSIHHMGRYHHVLPPPIASHVQGYALKGRSSTISMALNTTVATRPRAAAPAMPSVLRAAVHWAGRKATATPAARTISASTPPRRTPVIGTRRDPRDERHAESRRPDPQHDGRPPEQRERQRGAGDRDAEARPQTQQEGEGAVTAAAILLHLIQLSERIEPGEQRAEAEQDEGMARIEGTARSSPHGKRRERPEAPHGDHPVDSQIGRVSCRERA